MFNQIEDEYMKMKGASASIRKTLGDIEAILEGSHLPPEGQKREELRNRLRDVLNDLAVDWLKHGFKGGHIVAAKEFLETETFPVEIARTITRELPVRRKGEEREIQLQSKLPKKLSDRIKKKDTA